jgi:hypothetical protein
LKIGRETEVLGENLPQRHFLSTTHPTWLDPGLKPGRRGGKPVTNRLSYGAAVMGSWKRFHTPVACSGLISGHLGDLLVWCSGCYLCIKIMVNWNFSRKFITEWSNLWEWNQDWTGVAPSV